MFALHDTYHCIWFVTCTYNHIGGKVKKLIFPPIHTTQGNEIKWEFVTILLLLYYNFALLLFTVQDRQWSNEIITNETLNKQV